LQCKASLSSHWILFTIQNICEFVLQNTCYPNDDDDDDEQHTTKTQNQGTTKNSHIGHCAYTSESTNVKYKSFKLCCV
jgi:hypothetical protein